MTRALMLSLTLLAIPAAPSAQGAAPASSGAKAWVGHAAAIETHLRTAEVVRLEDIGTGVTRPRRAHLTPADPFESLVWKPLPPGVRAGYWESYKSEIAAYELDKLLGLDMVPPAAERQLDGEMGAAIMWLDGVRSVKEMGGKIPTGAAFGRPIRLMQMFDNVIGNIDRNAGNILIDSADNFILIDHSRAFTPKPELPWKFERVDAALWSKLKALDAAQLRDTLGPWIDAAAIDAIIGRRDRMRAAVDALVRRKGEAAVVIP